MAPKGKTATASMALADTNPLVSLPRGITESDWSEIVQQEESDLVAEQVMAGVMDNILSIIHERTVSAMAKPYAARRCKEQLSCLVESHFLNRDVGEPSADSWLPDEEPGPALPDSWARGCIAVKATRRQSRFVVSRGGDEGLGLGLEPAVAKALAEQSEEADQAAAAAAAAAVPEPTPATEPAPAKAPAKAKGKTPLFRTMRRASKPAPEAEAGPEPFQHPPLWEGESVLDALDDAHEMIESLTKSEMAELRGYHTPPALVGAVLEAVMIMFGRPAEWVHAKIALGSRGFKQALTQFDKDTVSLDLLAEVEPYVYSPALDPQKVAQVSVPAAALCLWFRAVYCYRRLQPMLLETARARETQRQIEAQPKRVPGERLVYTNGGTQLVKVESHAGAKDFGRQRVVPGIRITALEAGEKARVEPMTLQRRKPKGPTPPKVPKTSVGRPHRSRRTQPGGILTKRALHETRRAAAQPEPFEVGFGRRVGAPS